MLAHARQDSASSFQPRTNEGLTRLTQLVEVAIEGKYPGVRREDLRQQVAISLRRWGHSRLERLFIAERKPSVDWASDALNQARAYILIENVWRLGARRPTVEQIYDAVYGRTDSCNHFRKGDSAADFEGTLQIEVRRIPERVAALNRELARVDELQEATVGKQGRFLAHVHSSIIGIHPFEDGNGRCARMSVQYCLRRWGRPFIDIPKIRNDERWRDAIARGVAGERRRLERLFFEALTGRYRGGGL